jgi:hypothetical protein
MYVIDIDFKSGINTLHSWECVHAVPDNSPDKTVGGIGERGGWLSFTSPGEALRWLKENKVSGLIVHCKHCAPLSNMTPEPFAKMNVNLPTTGCDLCTREMTFMDTKSVNKRLELKHQYSK